MNCRTARESLQGMLDGDAPGTLEDAHLHLLNCPRCEAWYRQTKAAVRLLESAPEAKVPDGFAAAVIARLPERHPASAVSAARYSALVWAAWVAAAGLLFAVFAIPFAVWAASRADSLVLAFVRGGGIAADVAPALWMAANTSAGALKDISQAVIAGTASSMGVATIAVLAAVLAVQALRRGRQASGLMSL